ncbi:MAG TPA: hypothetical protein VMI31_05770 [Fimbriimonadaceae bacterium]|nr:hypothetical protein [Fimbriimonadaceae bacterium]
MALPPHIPLAVRIFPYLAECANNGRVTNTGELCEYVRGETRLFSSALGWIRDHVCAEHNLPPLTAIVEHAGRDTRSNSFAPRKLDELNREEYDKLRAEAMQKVYAYPRWTAVSEALEKLYTFDSDSRRVAPRSS